MKPRREDTQAWVVSVVRSGLGTEDEVRAQVVEAVRSDHPGLDADPVASRWIAEAMAAWRADAESWPDPTDHERLQQAFGILGEKGVVVLQGCADHWVARDVATAQAPTGIAWFTPTDVWHAVDEGMLEVNLWHGTTANAAPGDKLLDDAIAAFAAAGLEAHFDEGRIEVAAYWQRRPR
ncbi:MAG: DUF6891 domain-containing protein [Marmoricola sp.]